MLSDTDDDHNKTFAIRCHGAILVVYSRENETKINFWVGRNALNDFFYLFKKNFDGMLRNVYQGSDKLKK